jgi:hypothetical protein
VITVDEITRLDATGAVTREWMLGHPNPEQAREIRVSRTQLYPQVAHPGPAWRWLYTYTADGGPRREYGTGLADTRRFLRKTFPNAAVIETWR